ncbi:MAG: DinB family protein [Gemmatimonadaceae bacterium]
MESSIQQCRHFLASSGDIFSGLEDRHCALESPPGATTAGWLIGHLAVSGDFARGLCGALPICPDTWLALFYPGTQPSKDPAAYPPMRELCDTFLAVYTQLCDAAGSMDRAMYDRENPFTPRRSDFPRSGEFVAFLMSGHLGYHLGQLV